jgi:CRP-like cAMP-binding protein
MLKHETRNFKATTATEGLTPEDFERAGVRLAERHFEAKDIIFAPGDPDDRLYFLFEGTVRLKEGAVFGKLSLVTGPWQDNFAEALTDARVASAQKNMLTEVTKREPEFALKLFASFSERLRQSDEVIESLLHREVSARLTSLLLSLSDRFGETNGVSTLLDVRLTHQDLANMIASTREAVSKVMSEFQREGAIEVQNRKIVLHPELMKTL